MLALPDTTRLDPRDRFALACLVDASGLLPAEGEAAARAVRLELTEAPVDDRDLLRPGPERAGPTIIRGTDGTVRMPVALLRRAGALLAMERDEADPRRDRHARPLSAANWLVQAGEERTPVLSHVAGALRESARAAAGDRPFVRAAPWPDGRRWAAVLSHDLDVASAWPAFTALRMLELARKGDAGRLARVAAAAVAHALRDPVRAGVDAVMAAEARADARSTWFIICGTPTLATIRAGDVTYTPESRRVRAIVERLRGAGHEIGLHGSFETARDGRAFVPQRARLGALAGTSVQGVRQHFLKRAIGTTEVAMSDAGFVYDSTAGFPDRNGFRTGLADVHPVWDAAGARALPLEELPFCWMDRAQSKYQGIEAPDRWIDDALELADRVAAVQGAWCGIWHPNLTPALGFPGAHEAYARLVRELAARGAWLATAGAVVEWRRARRRLRVVAVSDDGRPRLAHDGARASMPLLDRTDRPLAALDAR